MFGIGSTELIVILIVALIIIGPKKLPEMARTLGKAMGEFRKVSTDVKRTIEMEADQAEEKLKAEENKKEESKQAEDKSKSSTAAKTESKQDEQA